MATMLALDHRRRHLVTAGLALWVTIWVVVGVVTGLQIRRLTEVSDSLVESGQALDTAGSALESVGRLPVVGEQAEEFGNEVRGTAERIRRAGASSRDTVQSVSVLLGAALVFIPILPVVGLYAPLRISLARQKRAVARAVTSADRDPRLEEFLAHRAVQNLPYDILRQVSADPWGDLHRRAYRHLANAELTRLGLTGRRWPGRAESAGEMSTPDTRRR